MGRDLSIMIEEINGASAGLSKTTKDDEPVSPLVLSFDAPANRGIDHSNCSHPQLPPVTVATDRPGNSNAASKGIGSTKG